MPTSMRQTIARYMTLSKQTIPHYYLGRPADVTEALRGRERWNADRPPAERASVNDLVVRAAARALLRHPNFNAHYIDNGLQLQPAVNIGVAISLADGLIAPALLGCADPAAMTVLGLAEVAQRSKDLAERARQGKLKASEYTGATFTVSNLGMYGVETFTAIIVPPQVAILAVGAAAEVLAPGTAGPITVRRMQLTLSADHRATDGAEGARFLADIVAALEDAAWLVA
jgi:pyruvate dehydrogenase E2 component (dihydrolipoamide acetyltransferase)